MRSFLVGIMLGAVAGILYAPATGNRTRSLLRDKVTKLSNDVPEYVDSKTRDLNNRMQGVKANVNRAIETARPRVEQAVGTMKEQAGQIRRDVMETRDKVMEQANQIKQDIKQDMASRDEREQRSA